jgi:hypothetical protein
MTGCEATRGVITMSESQRHRPERQGDNVDDDSAPPVDDRQGERAAEARRTKELSEDVLNDIDRAMKSNVCPEGEEITKEEFDERVIEFLEGSKQKGGE